jgi:cytochrome c-type biogenesis protein CcmF
VHWTGPIAVALIAFVTGTIGMDYARAVKQRRAQHAGESGIAAAFRTVSHNRRHWGGMVVHLGIVVMAIGLTGSGLFREEKAVVMNAGEVVEVGREKLRFDGVRSLKKDNYESVQARFTLLGSNNVVLPERRHYPVQNMPTTESGIHSNLLRDVYVVIAEPVPGPGRVKWGVHVYVNPLVQWIWTGGFVVLLGLVLTLSTRKRRTEKVAA